MVVKVLMLTKMGENDDEGMKNFGKRLYQELDQNKEIDIYRFNTNNIFDTKVNNNVLTNKFDVIHLIPGPSKKTLVLLKMLGIIHDSVTIATSIHPSISDYPPYCKPDIIFFQKNEDKEIFGDGVKPVALPSGVDITKYRPKNKTDLNIPSAISIEAKNIFLHVGHIKEGRNIRELRHLTDYGQVIIVGSPSTDPCQDLKNELQDHGIKIYTEYIDNIEDIYNIADIYVFPTKDERHSIQFPLSVLEAMACNLPIISTEFGALPNFIPSSDDFQYVDDLNEVDGSLISDLKASCSNRNRAIHYSWENIADIVANTYINK